MQDDFRCVPACKSPIVNGKAGQVIADERSSTVSPGGTGAPSSSPEPRTADASVHAGTPQAPAPGARSAGPNLPYRLILLAVACVLLAAGVGNAPGWVNGPSTMTWVASTGWGLLVSPLPKPRLARSPASAGDAAAATLSWSPPSPWNVAGASGRSGEEGGPSPSSPLRFSFPSRGLWHGNWSGLPAGSVAPPPRPFLLIAILSSYHNAERRATIRESYLRYLPHAEDAGGDGGAVRAVFLGTLPGPGSSTPPFHAPCSSTLNPNNIRYTHYVLDLDSAFSPTGFLPPPRQGATSLPVSPRPRRRWRRRPPSTQTTTR